MREKNKKTQETEDCILAEIAEILCGPYERLELHQLSAGPLLMKGSMTAAEVLDMLSDLHTLTEHLLDSLRKACGPCTEYCPEDCPLRFVEPFRMSNDLLEQAGIQRNANLRAIPDPENQCVYVEEGSPTPYLSGEAFRAGGILLESGVCMKRLYRHLRKGDVVYGER